MDRIVDYASNHKVVVLGMGTLSCGALVAKLWYVKQKQKRESIRRRIKSDRDAKIKQLTDNLALLEIRREWALDITKRPVEDLSASMKSGELSVVDVLHAFQYMAVEAHDKTNCLTNVFDDAEDMAKRLDSIAVGQRRGFLFGIPISVKDNVNTKGHLNTYGSLNFADNYPAKNQLLVNAVVTEGAIPFVKTNLPQIVMSYETQNQMYGRTFNPRDRTRTPGGSSGGEAALIGYGGSALGIGTDIAGSIRIPGSFVGVPGLKPTSGRMSIQGRLPRGQTVLNGSTGPMARDVESLTMFMRSVLKEEVLSQDTAIPRMPFDDSVYNSKKPLRIGFYMDDGYQTPSPANARAVMVTKRILERRGHKLVPWTPPDVKSLVEATLTAVSGDRGVVFNPMISADDIDPSLRFLMHHIGMHPLKRRLLQLYARFRGKKSLSSVANASAGKRTVGDWFIYTTECLLMYRRFESEWHKSKLDALICPTHVVPAAHLGSSDMLYRTNSYCAIYNLLDVPAGVVPVTEVSSSDIDITESYKGEPDVTRFVKKTLDGAEGLSVSVQCVTLRWREELCLRLMKEIEQAVRISSTT